jgi:hypothetical protein
MVSDDSIRLPWRALAAFYTGRRDMCNSCSTGQTSLLCKSSSGRVSSPSQLPSLAGSVPAA